jgi:hypothetical protein
MKWLMQDKFAEDWIALWQSELTAMAADRELRESITAMIALWASTANTSLSLLSQHESSRRDAQTLQPPRSTAVASASEPGLDEVASLHRRITELEQRLAGLERDGADT